MSKAGLENGFEKTKVFLGFKKKPKNFQKSRF